MLEPCFLHTAPTHKGGPANVQYLPSGGAKKLKKESFVTVLVTVRLVPRPLCFCVFLITFTVTFLPFFQSIVHLLECSNVCVRQALPISMATAWCHCPRTTGSSLKGCGNCCESVMVEVTMWNQSTGQTPIYPPFALDYFWSFKCKWVGLIWFTFHAVFFCQHSICEEIIWCEMEFQCETLQYWRK